MTTKHPQDDASPRQHRWDEGEWGDADKEVVPKTRSGARQVALRALYWECANPGQLTEALRQLGEACGLQGQLLDFANQLARAAVDHRQELEAMIAATATGWSPERIARVDGLILRLALAELLHVEGVPPRVTIHQAVELAKSYGGEKSYRFVNGLLDTIARQRGLDL